MRVSPDIEVRLSKSFAVGQAPCGVAGLAAADLGLADAQGGGEVGLGFSCEVHEGGCGCSYAFAERHLHGVIVEDLAMRFRHGSW